jgi:purine-binding chemotaxis protein CheW
LLRLSAEGEKLQKSFCIKSENRFGNVSDVRLHFALHVLSFVYRWFSLFKVKGRNSLDLALKQEGNKYTEEALYVIFLLSGEEFAAPVVQVSEVIERREITKVPTKDNFMEGIINIRGKVVPVINLRKLLRYSDGDYSEKSLFLIVDVAGQTAGLIVDNVIEVARVDLRNIQMPQQMKLDISNDYIKGVIFSAGRMIILIDLGRIFGEEISQPLLMLNEGQSVGVVN